LTHSAKAPAQKETIQRSLRRRGASSFTAEGDDGVVEFDPSRNLLATRLGRDFALSNANDRTTALTWAESYSLFHYKCDQRSHCALTRAGGGPTIYVTAIQ